MTVHPPPAPTPTPSMHSVHPEPVPEPPPEEPPGAPPTVDQTTLLQNEEESFALAPVDASQLKGIGVFSFDFFFHYCFYYAN